MSSKKNINEIASSIRDVPDFPKKGIVFKDITPVLSDINLFRKSIDLMVEPFNEDKIDVVVGIESRGFIFGTPIADKLNASFVPVRKPGKLPNETFQKSFELEYGSTSIEIQKNTKVSSNQKIVIVDDLVATGGTAIACAELFTENFNVKNSDILILGVIDLTALGGSSLIREKGYAIETLIDY